MKILVADEAPSGGRPGDRQDPFRVIRTQLAVPVIERPLIVRSITKVVVPGKKHPSRISPPRFPFE